MLRCVVTGMIAITMGCGRLSFDPLARTDANLDGTADGRADQYAQLVIADGPVAYWRFEESGGTVAVDEMGNYPGTFTGTVAHGSGIAGSRGAVFDGTTTRVIVGDVFAFAGTAPYTLEVWANPSFVDGTVRFLVDRSSSSTPTDGYQLYYADSFTLYAREIQGAEAGYASAPALVANRWAHLVATYDGDSNALYVDGELINSSPAPALPVATTGRFTLGDLGGDQFYKYPGTLDEVAIYPTALSAARIAAHTAAGR